MTSGPQASRNSTGGLVVEINHDAPDVGLQIMQSMAVLAWPHDEQRRRQWSAAYSALALQQMEHLISALRGSDSRGIDTSSEFMSNWACGNPHEISGICEA